MKKSNFVYENQFSTFQCPQTLASPKTCSIHCVFCILLEDTSILCGADETTIAKRNLYLRSRCPSVISPQAQLWFGLIWTMVMVWCTPVKKRLYRSNRWRWNFLWNIDTLALSRHVFSLCVFYHLLTLPVASALGNCLI